MPNTLKILGVHGLGNQQGSPWKAEWENAVRGILKDYEALELEFRFMEYDPVFENVRLTAADYAKAAAKLAVSGIHSVFRGARGWSDVRERVRWTAGYVVAWLESEEFRSATTKMFRDHVTEFRPDVILGHSLGSLVTYDAMSRRRPMPDGVSYALRSAHYVTFGSQIGNPFVYGNLSGGRIEMPPVTHWHHLFNAHDDIFTDEIILQGEEKFSQLLTPFDESGFGDHTAVSYLTHVAARDSFWRPIAAKKSGAKLLGGKTDPWRREPAVRETSRKALLVGINDYPNPADRLSGCVNDVFTMSAVLQECGFPADSIRTCLNERATAAAILERLNWLLRDARSGDELVFYYSGHGTRVPEYGLFEEADRLTETLVPWDFDWTAERSVSDEQIFALYSQLPYDTRLVLIFDCCHAGSMHRQGGSRPRAIAPPDDIRHRQLKWDSTTQMWVERDFARLNDAFSPDDETSARFFGPKGATVRIGRAAQLRRQSDKDYRSVSRKSKTPVGPYLPLIIEACAEDQSSYEYRHGATTYGAFTFCLASILREAKDISFDDLAALTTARLADLRYEQTPQILGPTAIVKAKVPWNTGRGGRPPPKGTPGGSTPQTSG